MQFKTRHKEPPTIEIAPLIDVVFLLLLFFMVTTQFTASPGLEIKLPEIKPGAPISTSLKIEINISAASDIFVAGTPVAIANLKAAIKQAVRNPGSTVAVVAADERAPHGTVVRVMDVLRDLGIRKMVIAARWKQPGSQKQAGRGN